MQGQANHFYRFTKERYAYPTQRYVGETERLYGVLDARLADRDYLAGSGRGKYSIADIANYGWVNGAGLAGIDLEKFPNVYKWFERLSDRPAVQKGVAVPSGNPSPFGWKQMQEKKKEDPEGTEEKERPLKEALAKAQKEFGYEYKSP